MKDSLKLMEIYRKYLEITEGLIDILERHCQKVEKNNLSDNLTQKYSEFRKHTHCFIEQWNDDLHVLLRLDHELKTIEDIEKKEKKRKNKARR